MNAKYDEIQKGIEGKADTSELVAKTDEIREALKGVADKEYVAKMNEQLKEMSQKLHEISLEKAENVDDVNSFLKSEQYQEFASGKSKSAEFNLKASTISTSNSFTEANGPIIPRQYDPTIYTAPKRGLVIQNLFQRATTGSDYVQSTYLSSETDGSAARAEAGTMGQSDLSWTSENYKLEHISAYIKVARQKLTDTGFIMNQINDRLLYAHLANLEEYCFDGTGATNQIDGIIGASKYQSFSAPSAFSSNVKYANKQDVLKVALAQLEEGNTADALAQGFEGTGVIVSISDYYDLAMQKDEDGRALMGMDGVMRIMGVPIFKSKYVTADYFLVGDFSASTLWTRESAVIRMWDQNSTDPIYDLVTFTINGRYALETPTPHTYAYVYGDFSSAIDAIDNTGQ